MGNHTEGSDFYEESLPNEAQPTEDALPAIEEKLTKVADVSCGLGKPDWVISGG